MIKDNDAKDVLSFFKSQGFRGEVIPTSDKETPDLHITDGAVTYVFEVKTKFDSQEYIEHKKTTLLASKIYEEVVPITPKNTIDGIIKKGCKQLKNSHSGDLFLLWIKLKTSDPQRDMDIAKQTILGIQKVWDVTNQHSIVDCYYFKNSSFFRHKDILDGIIFEAENGGEFWINNFSPRYKKIKTCELTKKIQPNDPLETVMRDGQYIVDGTVDRGSENEVIQYLMKKYKSENIKPFDMKSISVVQRVG